MAKLSGNTVLWAEFMERGTVDKCLRCVLAAHNECNPLLSVIPVWRCEASSRFSLLLIMPVAITASNDSDLSADALITFVRLTHSQSRTVTTTRGANSTYTYIISMSVVCKLSTLHTIFTSHHRLMSTLPRYVYLWTHFVIVMASKPSVATLQLCGSGQNEGWVRWWLCIEYRTSVYM